VPESGEVDEVLQRELIHGYYASVSYVDAQIGRVLSELSRLRLDRSTIVVLWGDHGFHLGDLGIWTKHTNYEQANRIPLLIAVPGMSAGVTAQPAESVDLYPTLVELAGLVRPQLTPALDGVSLVPVLHDTGVRVRDHAYHVFPKGRLGRAIRTERYRLVEWSQVGDEAAEAEYELYDYLTDPVESRNLASDRPAELVRLRQILAGYPRALKP
jgi:iduronate 2-sulfatase